MSHSHTVLVGPARCGKTHQLVGRYGQVLASAGPQTGRSIWLAPTARAAAAVRADLLRDGPPACLDPRRHDVRFARAPRARKSRGPAPRSLATGDSSVVTPCHRCGARREATAASGRGGRRSSFVDLLDEHFQELKRHGITAAAFSRTVGSRGERRQQEELAVLYASYEQLLADHQLVDKEGCHSASATRWPSDPTLLADLEIVVADGFADFTHTQLEILAALARRSGQLLVSLPGEANAGGGRAELFAKSAATLAELQHLIPKLKVQKLPCRDSDWPALDHIASHLFQHPRDVPPPSPGAIDSLEPDRNRRGRRPQDEIVELARNIKRQLVAERDRTGRSRPGDLVVVFRNLREAAPRVRDVFREFGIPHAIEAGVPLAATGLVRTLLDLLRLDADDWPFRRVTSVVTNNLLSALDRRARAEAEWLIRDLQIATGRDKLLSRLETLQASVACSERAEPPPRTAPAKPKPPPPPSPSSNNLSAALDAAPARRHAHRMARRLRHARRALGIHVSLAPTTDPDNHAAWQEITKHFSAREQFALWLDEPAPQLSRAGVIDLLVDLAKHESLPRPSDDTGRVRVLSAKTARTVHAKHLFLAGMCEQAFPSPERAGKLYSEADYRFFANAADQDRGRRRARPPSSVRRTRCCCSTKC